MTSTAKCFDVFHHSSVVLPWVKERVLSSKAEEDKTGSARDEMKNVWLPWKQSVRRGVTSDNEALSVLFSLLLNYRNNHINDEKRDLFVSSVAHQIKCSTLESKHGSEQTLSLTQSHSLHAS